MRNPACRVVGMWRFRPDEQPTGGNMAAPKRKTKKYQGKWRQQELAKIHIAKKQLGMDDGTYRQMLSNIAGVRSAADLSPAARKDVIAHLKSVGFVQKTKGKPKNMTGGGSQAAQLEKIEALLTIGSKPWSYADALAKRICKVEKVAWVKVEELYKIITALRKQAQREGWDLSGEDNN